MKHFIPFLVSSLLLIPGLIFGQLSTPGGAMNSNNSGNGIGIGTTTPNHHLHLNHFLNDPSKGLLYLNTYTGPVPGGSTSQAFAIRLDHENASVGISKRPVFTLGTSGNLQVGDVSLTPVSTLQKTVHDFSNSLGVFSNNEFLGISSQKGIMWGGVNALKFKYNDFNSEVLMAISPEGLGINTDDVMAPLHVSNMNSNNEEGGITNGLFIDSDGHLPTNYSIKVNTAWAENVFAVTDRGGVGIGTGDIQAPLHIENNDANNSETNKVNGLLINSSGHTQLNYSLKINTAWQQAAFTVSDRGFVGINTVPINTPFKINHYNANNTNTNVDNGILINNNGILATNYSIRVNTQWTPNAFTVTDRGWIGVNTLPEPQAPIHIQNDQVNNYATGDVNGLFISSNTANSADNYSLKIDTELGEVFTVTNQGNVLIKNTWSGNSGAAGQLNGLKILNNGYRGADFAFEIVTGNTNKVFDITNSGHVHIGPDLNFDIPNSDLYRLYVQDGIRAERVRVDIAAENGWADYVFEEGYQMMSLPELEAYISENKHLPGVPTTEEVKKEGIDLAEMNKILLEKVEELTLRLIELEKQVSKQ